MAEKAKFTYVKPTRGHVTSIGRYGVPLNKHKRRGYKKYRGQGRPR